MLRICKSCKQTKLCKFSHRTEKGKVILLDAEGKTWIGCICYNCFKDKQKQNYKPKQVVIKLCLTCNKKYKKRNSLHLYCSKACTINKTKEYQRQKVIERGKIKNCLECNNLFNSALVKRQKFCSSDCSRVFNNKKQNRRNEYLRSIRPEKPKKIPFNITCKRCTNRFTSFNNRKICSLYCIKPIKKVIKSCKICKKNFEPIHTGNEKYCSKKCRRIGAKKLQKSYPGFRKQRQIHKRNRKLKKLQRLPKWANIKEINRIYNNCPKGMHVDHIIPLNGVNVSGLHVEYNLQYLKSKDNINKSNQFDGTYNNLSWKIK